MTEQAVQRYLLINLLLVFAVSAQFAQPGPEVVAVRGKVVDRLTSLPVAGARVIVARSDRGKGAIIRSAFETQPVAGEQDPGAARTAVLTGDDGGFRFSLEAPAGFYLFVDAPGYVRPFPGIGPENSYEVSAGGSLPEILVRVDPALSVSGRVVDWETRRPVRGMAVWAQTYRLAGPATALAPAGKTRTREDGRFVLERLAPGDYYLEVRSPLGAKAGEPAPTEDFLGDVLTGYVTTWYPGVGRVQEAVPVKLWEGAPAQEVEMRVRRTEIARIRGRVLGGSQGAENSEVLLALARVEQTLVGRTQEILARGKVHVDSEFEIDGVPPGNYWLTASTYDPAGAERQAALLAIEVSSKNQQGLDLLLKKGIRVTGRVRIEGDEHRRDRPALPVDGARLLLRPLLRLIPNSKSFVVPIRGSDGSFSIEGIFPDKYHVRVLGAPAGYAVAKVFYNRAEVRHGLLSFGEAGEHKLKVLLAPADASVQVSVTDGIRPAVGATVVLVREPVTDDLVLLSGRGYRQAEAGEDGKTLIANLLPGRYRLSAYASGVLWAEDSNLWQRLASGESVIVGAATTVMAEVKVEGKR